MFPLSSICSKSCLFSYLRVRTILSPLNTFICDIPSTPFSKRTFLRLLDSNFVSFFKIFNNVVHNLKYFLSLNLISLTKRILIILTLLNILIHLDKYKYFYFITNKKMNLNWIKYLWGILNKIKPETRNVIIIFLFGWILYSQIIGETGHQIQQKFE